SIGLVEGDRQQQHRRLDRGHIVTLRRNRDEVAPCEFDLGLTGAQPDPSLQAEHRRVPRALVLAHDLTRLQGDDGLPKAGTGSAVHRRRTPSALRPFGRGELLGRQRVDRRNIHVWMLPRVAGYDTTLERNTGPVNSRKKRRRPWLTSRGRSTRTISRTSASPRCRWRRRTPTPICPSSLTTPDAPRTNPPCSTATCGPCAPTSTARPPWRATSRHSWTPGCCA